MAWGGTDICGQMDRWTDRQTDRCTDRQTYGQMDGWTDGGMDISPLGPLPKKGTDQPTDGRMDG